MIVSYKFLNFPIIYIFESKESISDIPTELPCFGDLENLGQLPVQEVLEWYWWLCLMNFWNFFTIYVFESEESNSDIPTELLCFGDLENPGQLPVHEVLGKILLIVSYKFLKFSHYLSRIYVFEVGESISDIAT